MKKPLTYCCKGDGRPVQLPSWVLCRECLAALDAKFQALKAQLACDKLVVPDAKWA